MVESVNGIPAASAACADSTSPFPCCMPKSPIGASASGADTFCPMMVVAVLRWETSTSTRWRNLMAFQIGTIGAEGLLVIGAAVGIFEKGARNFAAGAHAQILDAGKVFHGYPSGEFLMEIAQGWGAAKPARPGAALPRLRRLGHAGLTQLRNASSQFLR